MEHGHLFQKMADSAGFNSLSQILVVGFRPLISLVIMLGASSVNIELIDIRVD